MSRFLAILSVFAVITISFLNSCSSGKAYFEKGNYYQAVITSVGHLRRNPGHQKSVETLRQAYPLAIQYYEGQVSTAIASNANFKWTQVVNSYTTLNAMYDEIQRSPGALAVIPKPNNYNSQLGEARQNAAKEQYDAGIMALGMNTRDKAKEAYGYFSHALEYVAGYRDAQQKKEEALWAATIKVLVEPMPSQSKNLAVTTDFFNDKISQYVHSSSLNQYVRFFSPKEMQTMKLNPDHIIKIELDDLSVGNVYMSEKQIPLQKDSVVISWYLKPATTLGGNTGGIVNTGNKVQGQTGGGSKDNQGNNANAGNNNQGNSNAGNNNQGNANTGNQNQGNNSNAGNNNQGNSNAGNNNQGNANSGNQNQGNNSNAGNNNQGNSNAGNNNQGNANSGNQNQGNNSNAGNNNQGNSNAGNNNQDNANSGNQNQGNNSKSGNNNQGNSNAGNNNQDNANSGNQNQGNNSNSDNNNQGNSNAGNNNQGNANSGNQNQGNNSNASNNNQGSNTTDPKDQVIVCHIPNGNQAARHTLSIDKSALKAHLDHGDIIGSCEDPKNADKLKEFDKKNEEKKNEEKKKKGNDHSSRLDYSSYSLIASSSNSQAWQMLLDQEIMGDTVKVYGTVKATLFYYMKNIQTKGVISFSIVDAKTNTVLSVAKIPGEFLWKSEWGHFNGDERALTKEHHKITKQKEQMPPSKQELFQTFMNPVYDQITQKIKEFYKNY